MISLSEILHTIAQALMIPCLIILIILMAGAVWQIGDIVVEYIAERRKHMWKVSTTSMSSTWEVSPAGCITSTAGIPTTVAPVTN